MGNSAYSKLEDLFETYYFLNRNLSLLNWDTAVMLQPNSKHIRSKQIEAQHIAINNLTRDKNVYRWLCQAEEEDLNNEQAENLKQMQQIIKLRNALPDELQRKLAKQAVYTEIAWRTAKNNNDFDTYCEAMNPILDIVREKANILGDTFHIAPYEGLMFEYDYKLNTSEVELKKVFNIIEARLPVIITEICKYQANNNYKICALPLKMDTQKKICKLILQELGFDFTRGRLDESSHPFTEGGIDDVRITTNYKENDLLYGLKGAIHEAGHALYDFNLPCNKMAQPIAYDAGMTVHEAIALLYEMFVPSEEIFARKLQEYVASFNIKTNYTEIHNSLNMAIPGNIRIEADKFSYLLHILLRYDIEIKLLNRSLNIKDLPAYWDDRMQLLFGSKPHSLQAGCLQDIHWSLGLFGYFPCYAKGLLLAHCIYLENKKIIQDGYYQQLLLNLKNTIFSRGRIFDINSYGALEEQAGKFLDTCLK